MLYCVCNSLVVWYSLHGIVWHCGNSHPLKSPLMGIEIITWVGRAKPSDHNSKFGHWTDWQHERLYQNTFYFFPPSLFPTEPSSMVATETTDCSLCLTHLFCVDFLLSQFSFQQTVQKLCLFLLCGLMYLKINSLFPSAHAQPLCCITTENSSAEVCA